MIAILFAPIVVLWLICLGKQGNEMIKATRDDCSAGKALIDWLIANPDLRPGDFQYARELVLRKLKTHKRFLETHLFIKPDKDIEDYEEWLLSLLTPGPPPPAKSRGIPRKPEFIKAIAA